MPLYTILIECIRQIYGRRIATGSLWSARDHATHLSPSEVQARAIRSTPPRGHGRRRWARSHGRRCCGTKLALAACAARRRRRCGTAVRKCDASRPPCRNVLPCYPQDGDTEQREQQQIVPEGHEDLRHDPRLKQLRERGRFEHGCQHYKRRCRMVAPCCGEVFWCRHCHNKAKNEEEEARAAVTLPRDPLDPHVLLPVFLHPPPHSPPVASSSTFISVIPSIRCLHPHEISAAVLCST